MKVYLNPCLRFQTWGTQICEDLGAKYEEATRQQGGLFFWENSSNGGKAIRTF